MEQEIITICKKPGAKDCVEISKAIIFTYG